MQKTAKHGTRSRYVHHECRCPKCVKANRTYQRDYYRATHIEKG